MELNTFSVHREKIKGSARTQVTFDEDYNLPDYKPDFSSLIISQGSVRTEEVKVTKGHVSVKGTLKFEILYRAEQARQAKTLGETIREYRTRCGMTQEFVAEALGVSRQAVSKWESGRADPSTTNLIALAKLLEVPPEELLRGTR